MKCAVLYCKSSIKDSTINFHKFPNNQELFQKWADFCEQAVGRNAKVCSEHFLPDDYEGSLKVEMGFGRWRYLKKGAVPSVKKNQIASLITALKKPWPSQSSTLPQTSTKAAAISHKTSEAETQNKPSTAAKPVVKVAYILPKALNKPAKALCHTTPVTYASPTISLMTAPSRDLNCTIDYLENKVETAKKDAELKTKFLEEKIEALKTENQRLQQCSKLRLEEATRLEQQIVTLRQDKFKLELASVKYEKEKAALEMRVKRAEFEQRNLEQKLQTIFTPKQIRMIKSGKTQRWNEEDIKMSIKLYRTSPKMYIMLKEKNYPLPGVRTIQMWCQMKKIQIDGTEDDADKEIPSSTVKNGNQTEEQPVDDLDNEMITNDMFEIERIDENVDEATVHGSTEEEENTAVEKMCDDGDEVSSDMDAAFKLITYDSDETISAIEDEHDITDAISFDHTDKANENSILTVESPGIEVQEFIIP
ncbi:uncharacterized protein LOC118741210 [Rhagoletis pomonella]|uniref:uncharacterized protein LOC118741210 n=1 Tax=Rhagoletis pomonella TaxID=28610 RepID=UPI001781B188|nr:uncharacterized protein LOC118741210 [Rhagoletis pomonella]